MALLGRHRACIGAVALAVSTCLLLPAPAARAKDLELETRVKAAYVYKLLGFVRWVDGVDEAGVLTVCASAGEPLDSALDALSGRRVAEVPIRVRRVAERDAMTGCRVAFVASTPTGGRDLRMLTGQGVLTIGDSPGFAEAGGVIGFVRVGETVRFEVNLAAARRAGVSIDSRALRLATTVHGRDGGAP